MRPTGLEPEPMALRQTADAPAIPDGAERLRLGGAAAAPACEWVGYLHDSFDFADFPAGARVLDIGFGTGGQMKLLRGRGCYPVGLEVDHEFAQRGRADGLHVCCARAEALPFAAGGFDGVVCKVVVPYTDELRAIQELARVLRQGGVARVSYHGFGYFLRYLVSERDWRRRFYGFRTMLNTWWYALTGRRLPGFWGDTLYQSERRLRAYYAATGLQLREAPASGRYLGAPVFLYHVLERVPVNP